MWGAASDAVTSGGSLNLLREHPTPARLAGVQGGGSALEEDDGVGACLPGGRGGHHIPGWGGVAGNYIDPHRAENVFPKEEPQLSRSPQKRSIPITTPDAPVRVDINPLRDIIGSTRQKGVRAMKVPTRRSRAVQAVATRRGFSAS